MQQGGGQIIRLATLGVASGVGGNHQGCCEGPAELRHSQVLNDSLARAGGPVLDWLDILEPDTRLRPVPSLQDLTARIATRTEALVRDHRPFLVLGGDHSEAMGVWRGVVAALDSPRSFGLLWIDAHMDAHDFATTPSGNIHGMPLAALLGSSDLRLRRILGKPVFLNPAKVVLLGVRSYEPEEAAFLDRLGVRVVSMGEINATGDPVRAMDNAIDRLAGASGCFGISIDLDGLDPVDAPAVGTPVANGIRLEDLSRALTRIQGDRRFLGMEIAEFLPAADQNHRTEKAVGTILTAAFAGYEQHCRIQVVL